jgi:hypothetical protein
MTTLAWALAPALALLAAFDVRVAPPAPQPVAIVYELAGEALLLAPDRSPKPVRLFERLPVGASLELGPRARLALAFSSGLRYELGAASRATLGVKDLVARAGRARPLPPVPPLPLLAPIAAEHVPGARAGALRIRTERITGLYPRHGATVLAEATVLRFESVAGAAAYRVEIQDERGGTVFRAEPGAPPARVPAGALQAGQTYRWSVRTLDRPGPIARGEADFVTLSAEAARARERARRILEPEGPAALPLLAAIDRGLGLRLEAREKLRAALAAKPGEPALREAFLDAAAELDEPYARE